ncbi:hypothetical protein OSB04_018077 [Centaurea solstitialis]|uniref:Reverse transcriptase zinc-binding domain-containing protein n=1 Tax=Centaurea solstitialis TaxID=347529 RepID=A0AA38WA37_9ASTR|nr:hypothetical protein OSB04_018077 [Centaurea solstitialis]
MLKTKNVPERVTLSFPAGLSSKIREHLAVTFLSGNRTLYKANIHIWRAINNRLETKDNLSKSGVSVDSLTCPLCKAKPESVDHIFGNCSTSKIVSALLSQWVGWWPTNDIAVPDLLSKIVSTMGNEVDRKLKNLIMAAFFWVLWKQRNHKIFKGISKHEKKIMEDIRFTAFDWIRCRTKFGKHLSWEDWCCNPLNVVMSCITRGINLPSDLCPLCNTEKETEVHLFFSCPKVIDVWIWVSNWCGVELGHINSLDQLIFNLLDGSNSDRKRRFLEAVAGTTLWLIWKFRNNLVFNHKSFSASIVATEVQASLFTWLKYRAKCKETLHISNIPPQARRWWPYKEKLSKELKLMSREAFSENICHLKLGRIKSSMEFPGCDKFPDKMIIQVNVLCSFMRHRILCKKQSTLVVTKKSRTSWRQGMKFT